MLLLRWRYSLMRLLLVFLFVFVLHISADVVLADFSFFFSKKERCILSIEVNVCDFLCVGKGGLEKRKVAQISQISECEREFERGGGGRLGMSGSVRVVVAI